MPGAVQMLIKGSSKRVIRDLKRTRKASQRATVTALNKTARKVQTPAKREIASEAKIRAKDVTKRLRVRKATQRRPRAALGILMRPIPWIQLNARELGGRKKRGVRAGKHVDRQAFITSKRGQEKNPQVFKRLGPERTPLEVLKVDISVIADKALRKAVRGSAPIFRRHYSEQMQRWTRRSQGRR